MDWGERILPHGEHDGANDSTLANPANSGQLGKPAHQLVRCRFRRQRIIVEDWLIFEGSRGPPHLAQRLLLGGEHRLQRPGSALALKKGKHMLVRKVLGVVPGILAVVIGVGGCAVEPVDDTGTSEDGSTGPEGVQITDPLVISELQLELDDYVQSLLVRDVVRLDRLISEEVKVRARQMNSDVNGFADRMAASLRRELEQQDVDPASDVTGFFTIGTVVDEGSVLRVEILRNGESTGKPFYFVREAGEFKLNIKRPGFTKPLPEGAEASRDNYRFKNDVNWSPVFSCKGTDPFALPAATWFDPCIELQGGGFKCFDSGYTTKKCSSSCGWWTGTTVKQGSNTKKCDWNTWGDDVYVDFDGFWHCHDEC